MPKKKQSLQILLGPVPAALIGCGSESESNIITLAWVGVVNSSPPMLSAAIRKNRHSYPMIKESGEFTVNVPSPEQVALVDGCGTLSGKDLNKFEKYNLTALKGTLATAPMIEECPISMECKVSQIISLGSHDLFIGEVVSAYVSEDITDEKGKIDYARCPLLGFSAGSYLKAESMGLSLGYTQKK